MKQFKAESKRLMDLMIHSIYTNKDIFLRELISNASDALDKRYFYTMKKEDLEYHKEDFYIDIKLDKENNKLVIEDTGIGMTMDELENNLGTIAKSGSLDFKTDNKDDEIDIIGQFGVGFYSSFMVAKKIVVTTKSFIDGKSARWASEGVDGYEIEECEKDGYGTKIEVFLKEDEDDFKYSQYLQEYRIRELVKKYSDFIRYPIQMEITKYEEDKEVKEIETLNSMVPIWKRNKNELKEEDYENFYREKKYGYDKPLKHIHIAADGVVRYNAILYIPSQAPFNFYTKDYKMGLELYSSGVLIMDKCSQLIPDYFGFVAGMVDSDDLSLNISRELLQEGRQLQIIQGRIKDRVKKALLEMLEKDRESYEKFYESFSRSIKFGCYENFGINKDFLVDLLMFYSSSEGKLVTLKEYKERMKEDQKTIYYATGTSVDQISKLPQLEYILEKGYEVLYLTEDLDEFVIKVIREFEGVEFGSVMDSSVDIPEDEENKKDEKEKEQEDSILKDIKEILKDKVSDVIISKRLVNHPVCLSSKGALSIEMEKILDQLPDAGSKIKAEKILEINDKDQIFQQLKTYHAEDKEKFEALTKILFDQAKLIEGLKLDNPLELTENLNLLLRK